MNSSKRALTKTEHVQDLSAIAPAGPPARVWIDAYGQRASSFAAYLEIPFMHKRLIIVCIVLSILLGWVAILVWPRSYESEAKLMIRVGRESVALDPTATTTTTLMMQKTQEGEIVSALQVLNSRQVAERVVDDLGADAIMSGELPANSAYGSSSGQIAPSYLASALESWQEVISKPLRSFLFSAGVKDDISDRELAVRQIQSSVSIQAPLKSAVIAINARSRTPEMAQAIAGTVTDSFMDEHLKAAVTDGSYAFFEYQSADAEGKLNKLVAERSDFMQGHQIVSIDANRELLKQRLSNVQLDLLAASGQLQQAVAEVQDLISKIAATDNEIVAERIEAVDATWSGMRQLIYELELQEQNLAATYSESHPRLRRMRKQVQGAREILAQLESERVDENTTPNPIKLELLQQLQQQQTRIVGLRSLIEEKEKLRAEMETQIDELLDQERQLAQMDRHIQLLESSLQTMREKEEEARVIDQLHANKISNVHVFQPATFVERPVSPHKKLVAFGFLFLGVTSGLGLSLLRQGSSRSLRTREDVETELFCPVVASIPRFGRMASPRWRDLKAYRRRCQTLITEILLSQRHPGRSRGRSIGIIAADAGAGASTLAANLAVVSSDNCKLRTVLVDADSRRRSISTMFGLNGGPGLVELVSGSASHDECLQRAKNTPVDLIASAADSCDEILTSTAPEIVQALQAYLQDYDLLIVDLPAANEPDQAISLAQHLDSVLVVVESEKTETACADRLLCRLSDSDTQVIGVVLNKTRSYLPKFLGSFVAPQV